MLSRPARLLPWALGAGAGVKVGGSVAEGEGSHSGRRAETGGKGMGLGMLRSSKDGSLDLCLFAFQPGQAFCALVSPTGVCACVCYSLSSTSPHPQGVICSAW